MTLEAIKEAIQQLPEPDRCQLAEWFEEKLLLAEDPELIHEKIGIGLAQLDRGEGVPGEVSRAWLQDKKEACLKERQLGA